MGIASIVNGVGNIVNTLFDLSPKSFYSIADFYNFIKKRQNAPMARKHFTIVPRIQLFALNGTEHVIWDQLFTDKNLAKFAITAQKINYSTFGYSSSGSSTIKNQFGSYVYTSAKENFTNGGSFKIDFLQTAQPIIQSFIVPWFYECNRTNYSNYSEENNENKLFVDKKISGTSKGLINQIKNLFSNNDNTPSYKKLSQYPVPKLTLDIKFYRMDQIAGLQFLMNPTFVYRLSGVYPLSFDAARAQHNTNYTLSRGVTFNYNSFLCIPGPKYQMFLTGNTNVAFAYQDMSPIQILNALNQTIGGAASIVNNVKGMF